MELRIRFTSEGVALLERHPHPSRCARRPLPPAGEV